jgi:hypothetical protein
VAPAKLGFHHAMSETSFAIASCQMRPKSSQLMAKPTQTNAKFSNSNPDLSWEWRDFAGRKKTKLRGTVYETGLFSFLPLFYQNRSIPLFCIIIGLK